MANDLALYLFKQGTNYKAYEYLGAHRESKGVYTFRVWAPNADAVYIAGDFNGWQADIPMKNDGGVWSITLKGFPIGKGDRYKYIIRLTRMLSFLKQCQILPPVFIIWKALSGRIRGTWITGL